MPIRRLLVVLVLVLVSLAACRRGRKPHVGQSFTLANGLRVELEPGACGDGAVIAVQFEVGADHDPMGRSGQANLIARLLARPERIVSAGVDHTAYAATVPRDGLLDALDRVAAEMVRLEVTDADVGRARTQVLEEVARRRGGDPMLTAMSYAAESVQPTRGSGWRGGIAAEVETIDAAAVSAAWQAHAKPANARLIVMGRFDPAKVRARLEAAFADVPTGTPPVLRPAADTTVTGTLVMGDAPSAIAIAVPAPAPTAPLYPAFLILAARLPDAPYDPLATPETLFVTALVAPGEPAEPAAARLRAETLAIVGRPLAPADVDAARKRFAPLLGGTTFDSSACAKDPRGYALARVRRAQLGLDGTLATALAATTQAQLDEAAALFDAKHTAAVIAGGTIR